MLDDYKTTIPYQATPCIDHAARFRSSLKLEYEQQLEQTTMEEHEQKTYG